MQFLALERTQELTRRRQGDKERQKKLNLERTQDATSDKEKTWRGEKKLKILMIPL